jgi:hypothetical protein
MKSPLVLLVLLAACAAPESRRAAFDTAPPRPAPELATGPAPIAERPTPEAPETQALLAVAYVAGDPIGIDELFASLLHRKSLVLHDTLDRLVTSRLALLEAGRLGVRLDPALVDQQVAADKSHMESLLAQSGREVDRYLVEELGLDPTRYFELMRNELVQQLLTQRVLRAWTLGQERCELRAIVTATEADMDAVRARLAAGEDFAVVAKELSVDPSGEKGGALPPVVRSELAPLARLAFETEIGALGGPMEEDGHWILLEPQARPEPLTGDWDALEEAVEASLAARPVEDPEYWQWRAAMARRYQIDLAPLLELAGEPRAADGS